MHGAHAFQAPHPRSGNMLQSRAPGAAAAECNRGRVQDGPEGGGRGCCSCGGARCGSRPAPPRGTPVGAAAAARMHAKRPVRDDGEAPLQSRTHLVPAGHSAAVATGPLVCRVPPTVRAVTAAFPWSRRRLCDSGRSGVCLCQCCSLRALLLCAWRRFQRGAARRPVARRAAVLRHRTPHCHLNSCIEVI